MLILGTGYLLGTGHLFFLFLIRRKTAYIVLCEHLGKTLTTVFIAGPKTTVTIKYWELLSTSVSVKEVYITSFQGRLLEYDGEGGRYM